MTKDEKDESEVIVVTIEIKKKVYDFVQSLGEMIDKALQRPNNSTEYHCQLILEEAAASLAGQFLLEAGKTLHLSDDEPEVLN